MIKSVANEVWAYDCEWVPDLRAGRLVYGLPEELPDSEVLRVMWEQGGATPENPMPFLRTVVCRVVSIATVIRRTLKNGEVQLFLSTLPEAPEDTAQDEAYILHRFLADGVSTHQPQLVGFNSRNADQRILTQRAIVNGLSLKHLCDRINAKPWESNDIDLMDLVAGFGKSYAVSLHEIATLCGIPGKLDTTGDDVQASVLRRAPQNRRVQRFRRAHHLSPVATAGPLLRLLHGRRLRHRTAPRRALAGRADRASGRGLPARFPRCLAQPSGAHRPAR